MLTKRQKRILSKTFRNQKVGRYGEYVRDWDDPLVVNLSEDWRSRGDGEDVVYYTIFGYDQFQYDYRKKRAVRESCTAKSFGFNQ